MTTSTDPPQNRIPAGTLFLVFLRLGLTSFGGPVAHLGYFREEFVHRRRWLDDRAYADLVALCQFLPGPASSQVGIGIGLSRGGLGGALAAWAGFTLPSALLMIAFALGLSALGDGPGGGWLNGLKIAAVAVVAQAVWSMAQSLCPDARRATFAVAGAVAVLLIPGVTGQLGVIAVGGILGMLCLSAPAFATGSPGLSGGVSPTLSVACLVSFLGLLIALPLLAGQHPDAWLAAFDSFYRAGALIFGGGHVVLPLLHAEVVQTGRVDHDAFLVGYGAAQALPGPLVTFSAYLGASMDPAPGGAIAAAVLCLVAMFTPSFLLVIGCLPWWDRIRRLERMQRAAMGVNAAVVGILLAALYDPVWTSAVHGPADFALVVAAWLLLVVWKLPPWLVVGLCAAGGGLTAAAGF